MSYVKLIFSKVGGRGPTSHGCVNGVAFDKENQLALSEPLIYIRNKRQHEKTIRALRNSNPDLRFILFS